MASLNYTTLTRETGIAECLASGRMRFSAVSVQIAPALPSTPPPLGWAAMRRRSGMDFCAMKRLAVNASCASGPFADRSNCMSLFTSDDSGLSGGVAIGSPKACPHHQRRPYAFLSFMATYNHARQPPWLLNERANISRGRFSMADLFDKIANDPVLMAARMGREQGIYPYFKPLSETEGAEVVIDGRRLIMIGSNNYLGLTTHPRVRRAAIEAIERYGTSCTGSRFLNGTLELHKELERRLARFLGKEAALIFGTGYQANLGAITALMGKDDIAVADREIHASLVDAIKMAGCQLKRFRHNDMNDLERVLRVRRRAEDDHRRRCLLDGGDLADLPQIVTLAKRYGARLFVDDAHGLGVMGEGGRGTHFHFGCVDDVDLIMGTFSKSFASLGGVVAGDCDVIDYIQHHARSLIFSASMPPANVATVLACLDIIEEDPSYVQRVHVQSAKVREGLRRMGYDCGQSVTPIVPVYIKNEMHTVFTWKALFDNGVYTNPVLPPAVPPSKSLLRTSYMATHTDEQIETVLRVFEHVGQLTGLLQPVVA